MFEKKKKLEKRCPQCLAYIPYEFRKCRFCGYKFKSLTKYIGDRIKRTFVAEKVYPISHSMKINPPNRFFESTEIEVVLDTANFQILMYMILDDLAFIDETSLIELGRTIMSMNDVKTQL